VEPEVTYVEVLARQHPVDGSGSGTSCPATAFCNNMTEGSLSNEEFPQAPLETIFESRGS